MRIRVVIFGNTRWKLAHVRDGEVVARETGVYPFDRVLPEVDVTLFFSVHREASREALPRLRTASRRFLTGEDFRPHVPLCYTHPETFGEDRLLLVAFGMSLGEPTLVVDAGTAITLNLVHPERGYAGGAILPGLSMGLSALHRHTSLLPLVEATIPEGPGCSTESAMRLGVIRGSAGAIRELSGYLAEHVFPPRFRYLTGGDAALLAPLLPDFHLSPDLAVHGALWLLERFDNLSGGET